MKTLGYNSHVTIQIALAGNAADLIKHHDRAAQRGEQLPRDLLSSSISSMRTSPRLSRGLRRFLMSCLVNIAQILQNRRNYSGTPALAKLYRALKPDLEVG